MPPVPTDQTDRRRLKNPFYEPVTGIHASKAHKRDGILDKVVFSSKRRAKKATALRCSSGDVTRVAHSLVLEHLKEVKMPKLRKRIKKRVNICKVNLKGLNMSDLKSAYDNSTEMPNGSDANAIVAEISKNRTEAKCPDPGRAVINSLVLQYLQNEGMTVVANDFRSHVGEELADLRQKDLLCRLAALTIPKGVRPAATPTSENVVIDKTLVEKVTQTGGEVEQQQPLLEERGLGNSSIGRTASQQRSEAEADYTYQSPALGLRKLNKSAFSNEPLSTPIHIQEVYGDLRETLGNSLVDRVVRLILDDNILVPLSELKFKSYVSHKNTHLVHEMRINGMVAGKFSTTGDRNDVKTMMKNWRELIRLANVPNEQGLCAAIRALKSTKGHSYCRRRNVIGCFLGQNLDKLRHSTDILDHGLKLIGAFVSITGRFSPQEDSIILRHVQERGASTDTFKQLMVKLKRGNWTTIQRRFKDLDERSILRTGKILIDETCLLIDSVFRMHPNCGIYDLTQDMLRQTFSVLRREFRRNASLLYNKWQVYVAPIVMAFLTGRLNTRPEPEVLSALIEEKVKHIQDVDWCELQAKFPYHTLESLRDVVSRTYNNNKGRRNPFLYEALKKGLPHYLIHGFTALRMEQRDMVASAYEHALRNYYR